MHVYTLYLYLTTRASVTPVLFVKVGEWTLENPDFQDFLRACLPHVIHHLRTFTGIYGHEIGVWRINYNNYSTNIKTHILVNYASGLCTLLFSIVYLNREEKERTINL